MAFFRARRRQYGKFLKLRRPNLLLFKAYNLTLRRSLFQKKITIVPRLVRLPVPMIK